MSFRTLLALNFLLLTTGTACGASERTAAAARPVADVQERFSELPTRVGDQVEQQVAVDMQLKTTITQSGQLAHESDDTMRRQQRRLIEVVRLEGKQLHTARVSFPVSRLQAPDENAPQEEFPADLLEQPIEGKSYLVTCGKEQLAVTDLQGEVPPLEEFKLVSESLSMLGKPNLLAKFLIERQPKAGDRLLVPRAIAKSMLGMNDKVGAIKRFEMTLLEITPPSKAGESPQAVFQAKIETMPNDASPMAFAVEGRVVIEVVGCRTTAADLAGPISMSTIEAVQDGFFQYSVNGELRMALRSKYASSDANGD